MGLGSQKRVDVAGSEEVKGRGTLGDKAIPELERKIGIRATYAGNKVFFECADGLFCGVIAMVVRREKL